MVLNESNFCRNHKVPHREKSSAQILTKDWEDLRLNGYMCVLKVEKMTVLFDVFFG